MTEPDDVAVEALLEFLNACEAGVAAAKQRIKEAKEEPPAAKPKPGPLRESWDPSKISWTSAQGSKGVYERSEDVNNSEFKAMLKDLGAHKGKLNRDEYFYWTFQNGSTVGRKRRGKA